jgi:hypothetical protein
MAVSDKYFAEITIFLLRVFSHPRLMLSGGLPSHAHILNPLSLSHTPDDEYDDDDEEEEEEEEEEEQEEEESTTTTTTMMMMRRRRRRRR